MQSMYFSKGADCVDKREGLCDVRPCNAQFAFSSQKRVGQEYIHTGR